MNELDSDYDQELEFVHSNSNNINKEEYYNLDSNGEIEKFSFKGYQLYLLLVTEKYLQNSIDRIETYDMYINITDNFMISLQYRYNKLNNYHSSKNNNNSSLMMI